MMRQTEPFDDYVKQVKCGKPYLYLHTTKKTGFACWSDGTLGDYEEFKIAVDHERMTNELRLMFHLQVPETRKRAVLHAGSVHGSVSYVPPEIAVKMFELVRKYFSEGLKVMVEHGVGPHPIFYEEKKDILTRLHEWRRSQPQDLETKARLDALLEQQRRENFLKPKRKSRRLLKKGDRIRLKEPLLSGWKGIGTVTEDQLSREDGVWFAKDGDDPDRWGYGRSTACDHEVALLRDQNQ